jgi:hypothetical protein
MALQAEKIRVSAMPAAGRVILPPCLRSGTRQRDALRILKIAANVVIAIELRRMYVAGPHPPGKAQPAFGDGFGCGDRSIRRESRRRKGKTRDQGACTTVAKPNWNLSKTL